MKKLLLLSILVFLYSCEKPKKTYYSVIIQKDSFGGTENFEEIIDTLKLENDSLAMIENFTSYLISKLTREKSKKEYPDSEYLTTEILDYKLLDENKNPIVSTISEKEKKEIEKSIIDLIYDSKTETEITKSNPEEQFSKWDGSHIKLTEYIKSKMNDPDSYEHVETKAATKSNHILVVTTIRGTNAYGGKITTTYQAKCDKDTGEVLSISQQ
jgi:hypothetical protein